MLLLGIAVSKENVGVGRYVVLMFEYSADNQKKRAGLNLEQGGL